MGAAILPMLLLAGYAIFVWWLWREVGASVARRDSADAREEERARLSPERVLFVCTHNSARSQMAEALLRHVAGARLYVASAGTERTTGPLEQQLDVFRHVYADLEERILRWVSEHPERPQLRGGSSRW